MGDVRQDLTGCAVGFYKLEEPIGLPGAQGRTYKATHVMKKEPAAIKILTDPTEEEIERFRIEAELLGSLSHPNIERIIEHDYDQPYKVFYIAKNLVEGVPLTNVLRARRNGLSVEEILEIAEQLTWALAHAHAREIYHLDLKPSNILIECQENDPLAGKKVWLIDYGFGVWGMREGPHTAFGTYQYWAPEQVKSERLTRQTDLYQFGNLLYEMLTGRVPFQHKDPTEVMRRIVQRPASSPTSIKPTLPQSIDNFFTRALAKSFDSRFSSVEQMFEALLQSVPEGQRYIQRGVQAGPDLPPPQLVTTRDGVKIAYTVRGSGHPLVYPPPWVTHQGLQWVNPRLRSFFENLATQCRLISYDKRGCGLSDRLAQDLSWEAQLGDLEVIINHLGLDRFAFMAISGAGPLAITYAATHPQQVSKLILYGTYADGHGITSSKEFQQEIIRQIREDWGRVARFFTDLFIPGASEEERNWLALYQRASSSAEQAALFLSQIYELDVSKLARTVQCPTLIIHRFSDQAIAYRLGEEVATLIPRAKIKRLEGNIHLPWLGESQPVIDAILEFLEENPE